MKRIFLYTYAIALSALAFISVATTFTLDNLLFFSLDFIISFLIVCGVFLYIKGAQYQIWKMIFLLIFLVQIYFLFSDERMQYYDILFWIVVLAPAFYMNAKVAGITSHL